MVKNENSESTEGVDGVVDSSPVTGTAGGVDGPLEPSSETAAGSGVVETESEKTEGLDGVLESSPVTVTAGGLDEVLNSSPVTATAGRVDGVLWSSPVTVTAGGADGVSESSSEVVVELIVTNSEERLVRSDALPAVSESLRDAAQLAHTRFAEGEMSTDTDKVQVTSSRENLTTSIPR